MNLNQRQARIRNGQHPDPASPERELVRGAIAAEPAPRASSPKPKAKRKRTKRTARK